jgi:hypothetical protein
MLEWVKASLAVLAIVGLFWAAFHLLRRAQGGDPSKRGQDSSEPGGFSPDV